MKIADQPELTVVLSIDDSGKFRSTTPTLFSFFVGYPADVSARADHVSWWCMCLSVTLFGFIDGPYTYLGNGKYMPDIFLFSYYFLAFFLVAYQTFLQPTFLRIKS
jgi:hypothetical protein